MGAMMLVASALSAVGSIASGAAQAKAANYQAQVAQNNATIARQNAMMERQAGDAEATAEGMKARERQGGITAALAANGVDVNSGSAAAARESQEGLGLLDTMTIRSNAAKRAYNDETQATNFEAQGKLDRMQGSNAQFSSMIGAASSLAGGLGKYYQQTGTAGTGGWITTTESI